MTHPSRPSAPLWRVNVLTLFPQMFPGPLGHSLAGKALAKGIWALQTVDIRAFARDKHTTVDGPPFGGGAGMVMRPDVLDAALESLPKAPVLCLSPRGRLLTQARVEALATEPVVSVVCGRYEGIDARVIEARDMEEVSMGDYVLSGGEPAALALIDACVRLLPGVMGQSESLREESFRNGLLEYPHYTHPRRWRGQEPPAVLLSGHHGDIAAWRTRQAEDMTKRRRPDLWQRYSRETHREKK